MRVMKDIRRRGNAGETDLLLIVPDQYSHDAERQLCAVCGDGLSLYGETLSFTRLCGRVFSETGGAAEHVLDSGGQILVMYRALESVSALLKVFGAKGIRAEIMEKLLDAVKEFKNLCISPAAIEHIAEQTSNPLRDKLHDLLLLYNAYNALLHEYGCDDADRLTLLANRIKDSVIGNTGQIYFDGFNDFTALELRVIGELLKKNAELTVCLTCDISNNDSEVFMLPNRTAGQLRRLAAEFCIEVKEYRMGDKGQGTGDEGTERIEEAAKPGVQYEARGDRYLPLNSKTEELIFLEKHLFEQSITKFQGECRSVAAYSAPNRYAECEYAAYIVWKLVRGGYNWRDIGVMARNWEEYGSICENIFEKYDVAYFSSGRTDVREKPPAALIEAALDIAVSGFEYKPVFKYLKTGLLGISADACAELENYVIMWNIRGAMWTREWTLPTNNNDSAADEDALRRINDLRRLITKPLTKLRHGIKGVSGADVKLPALYHFFENIKLPERLAEKAELLEKMGETRLADEYLQLWGIMNNAMEQFYAIIGNTPISAIEFRKLFSLTLSRYDVGVIPVSLDRTVIGGMAMSRRRDLKCLIVLGATDENLPMLTGRGGAFSDSERQELSKLGVEMPAGIDDRISREMNMLYSTFTLPSHELAVTYSTGGEDRPSYIVKRIEAMFGIIAATLPEEEYMSAAVTPCYELALMDTAEFCNSGYQSSTPVWEVSLTDSPSEASWHASAIAAAARKYFSDNAQCDLIPVDTIAATVRTGRGELTKSTARMLYGQELSLSASRVDKYYSCRYLYFLQSGLHLVPEIQAGYEAPAAGLFMHYVLEGVSREIKESVGFRNTDEKTCRDLTSRYIKQYIHDELFDFESKNARFIYLFRRLEENVQSVVLNMLEELKTSDFEPLDFELDFSLSGLKGIIDRVDGWTLDEKLYIRVIDYKTGKEPFTLSDVLYGKNMQLLIYLIALQKSCGTKYGTNIIPAGVLLVPVHDVIASLPRNSTDEEIEKNCEKKLRRSGLVLDDPCILEAMENGDAKKYLPVKVTKNGITGDSLVSPDQVALLSDHVESMLHLAAEEILNGKIECNPYYKSSEVNACLYCEYHAICAFDENSGDKRRFIGKMKASEFWATLGARKAES